MVGSFGSPGAFVHGDESGTRIAFEVLGAGDELNAGVVVVEVTSDGLEPEWALEPPMAEEFGVEGRGQDGRDGIVEAGFEGLMHEVNEVSGVGPGTFGCLLRVVGLLRAHIDAWTGNAPISMPAGPALLVEIEVDGIAGIAGVARPDLEAGARIAGKDGGCEALVVGAIDIVGLVK